MPAIKTKSRQRKGLKRVIEMELARQVSTRIVSRAKIETLKMPEKARNVFLLLADEKNLGIQGGYAKLLFQVLLKQQGEIKANRNYRAQGFDGASFDLDLLISYKGSRTLELPQMDEQVNNLIDIGVDLEGKNIDARQGNITDERFIWDYLQGRDMTVNEVTAVPIGNGTWKISFTDKCQRDTINGAAILTPNGQGTIRWHNGMMIASSKGTIRLVQALIESKVESIYLPQLWIDKNREEALIQRKQNLGYYGYLICQRYIRNKTLQAKLMKILKMLQLTDFDEDKFADFYNEQSNAAKFFNNKFHYNPNMSFLEHQQRLMRQKKERRESQKDVNQQRQNCKHNSVEISICDGCSWKCKIWKCIDCSSVKITPNGSETFAKNLSQLLCNKNFINSSWYWDKQGFVYG